MRRVSILVALLLAAAAASALGAPPAEAHKLYNCQTSSYNAGSLWCHLHTRYYYFYNGADGRSYDMARDAQIDWHQQTTLDLSSTDHASSRIHHQDDYIRDPYLYGYSLICSHGCTQHTYNNSYSEGPLSNYQVRATACHEIGHAIGHKHYNGDGSCMGWPNEQYMDRISSHVKYETNDWYAAHL
jgi:hypothetical protein